MKKTYQITFQEYEKDESQTMQVKTKDIDWTVEQIGRNRNIKTINYEEIKIDGSYIIDRPTGIR
jgi:hypothetical protein